ncbi:hypothetical protein NB688_003101 [Xanthomonas sacchari]|uniref:Transposase n=1 Tax=Xanthomonas sacchari TaxID=56458 RepID=A0ABT3E071_9XANT|nr:hypothetical protein CEK68_19595 [Xanthomonas sp. LMG 12461]MCW0401160.1 hypothetical protein [Xanthomonas sacchari]MCW0420935.1 hypothetical protein [Xanthomonas sacchari]
MRGGRSHIRIDQPANRFGRSGVFWIGVGEQIADSGQMWADSERIVSDQCDKRCQEEQRRSFSNESDDLDHERQLTFGRHWQV